MYDAHSNLGYSTIVAAPFPALTGTNLTVQSGQGALFPATPFNCTVWPAGVQPLASNAEIVTVTAVVGDTFTITRAQEGTTNQPIAIGFQIANTTSVKVFTDIENSIIQFVSAGTTKAGASEVVFGDANGISFGVNGQTITASAAGLVQSTQPVAASASNGSFSFSTLGFVDGNGVTFGTGAGGISASVAAGAGGVAISAAGSSQSAGTIVFSNSNNITFGLNGSTLTASASFSQTATPIAAGTQQATAGVSFVNSNGITFGMSNSSDITASFNGLTSQSNQAASASNGSFTFQTLGFANGNGVTFGTGAGSLITASVNTSGGGVGSLVGFEPHPAWSVGTMGALFTSNNTYMGADFCLPANINAKFARLLFNFTCSATNATTLNSGSATGSFGETGTFQQLYYTTGTGASTDRLMMVSSDSCSSAHLVSFSMTNSTQYSFSHSLTIPTGGGTSTYSTSYALSTNSYVFSTSNVSLFAGLRMMDVNASASLTAGNYMFMFGQFTSSSQSAGALTAIQNFTFRQISCLFNKISSVNPGYFGSTGGQQFGFGGVAFWRVAVATTSELATSALSNNFSLLYFSLKT